jgi:hypothetical protein
MENLYLFMEKLHKIICKELNINYEKSFKTKKREYVQARQWTMWITYLLYKNKVSLREIGIFFNKDHATVLHAKKNILKFCEIEFEYKEKYNIIYKKALNIFFIKNYNIIDNKKIINNIKKTIYKNCNINLIININNMLSQLT